jgi:hypothetical protein
VAGKSKIKAYLVFGEGLLFGLAVVPSCCVFTWWKKRPELLTPSKVTNTIHEGFMFITRAPPKGPTSKYHHFVGGKSATYEVGNDTNIQSIANNNNKAIIY